MMPTPFGASYEVSSLACHHTGKGHLSRITHDGRPPSGIRSHCDCAQAGIRGRAFGWHQPHPPAGPRAWGGQRLADVDLRVGNALNVVSSRGDPEHGCARSLRANAQVVIRESLRRPLPRTTSRYAAAFRERILRPSSPALRGRLVHGDRRNRARRGDR